MTSGSVLVNELGHDCTLPSTEEEVVVANKTSIETSIAELSRKFSLLESSVSERVNTLKSEFQDFKESAICIRYDEDYITTLKKSNKDLKDENEALKEKVADLSYLLSDLRREIRHVEEERQSLVAAIKILQHDYQNANEGSNKLNHDEDKSSGYNFKAKKTNITSYHCENNNEHKEIKSSAISYRSPQLQDCCIQSVNNFSILSDELIEVNKTEQEDEAILHSNETVQRDQSAKTDKRYRLGNRAYDRKSEIENSTKKLVFIAGDSIIQHVQGWELSNAEQRVAVKSIAGSKIEDMEDYLKPLLRKTADEIILHVGTNNVKDSESSQKIAESISKLGGQIKENSPNTKVAISSIIIRKDKACIRNKIKHINVILKNICDQNGWTFIDNRNIDFFCLNRRGIHLNRRGSSLVTQNFLNHLRY